jgi:hypothetical protein
MSHNVFEFGSRASAGLAAPGPERPAEVIELAARRPDPVEAPPMPTELWDEIDEAGRRWQDLVEQGQEVRFHGREKSGRVRASLREVRNGVELPLPLTELFGPRDDGPPAAA